MLIRDLPRKEFTFARKAGTTCGQETVRGEQQLRRNLHLQLVLRQLEDGEVLLFPLVVRDSPFVSIISCGHKIAECVKSRASLFFSYWN